MRTKATVVARLHQISETLMELAQEPHVNNLTADDLIWLNEMKEKVDQRLAKIKSITT
jgi:hypothetical protein